MTAKEYMKQYGRLKHKADILKTEYEAEKQTIDTIRAAGSGDGTPSSGKISTPTETKAIRLADKLTAYQNAELEALEARQKIFDTICAIPGEFGQVLFGHYLEMKSWQEVADDVGYSLRQTHRIHQAALIMAQDVIEWHFLSW